MVPSEATAGRTKRREAADSRQAARRRDIVDAAAVLFQSRGYYATSVGDIADQVGMSKPTIYHYFRSKEEILVYIHDMIADRLLADHERVKQELDNPIDRLRALCESFFAVMTDLQPHVRTFFTFFGEVEGGNRQQIEFRRQTLSDMVEESHQRMHRCRKLSRCRCSTGDARHHRSLQLGPTLVPPGRSHPCR